MYDVLIMDHIWNARNYRVLEDSNRTVTGINPLCGDEITVYLRIGSETLQGVSFQCVSCGISMASASIMTEIVKHMPADAVGPLVHSFLAALWGRADLPSNGETRGQ